MPEAEFAAALGRLEAATARLDRLDPGDLAEWEAVLSHRAAALEALGAALPGLHPGAAETAARARLNRILQDGAGALIRLTLTRETLRMKLAEAEHQSRWARSLVTGESPAHRLDQNL